MKIERCCDCGKTCEETDLYYDGINPEKGVAEYRCFECIKVRCADSQPICGKCGKAVEVLYEGKCEDCLRREYSSYKYRWEET